MTITDKRYPLCSKLKVLRSVDVRNGARGTLVVSTRALHDAVGWKLYQEFLPHMQHVGPSVTPGSCEAWLKTMNGKLPALVVNEET